MIILILSHTSLFTIVIILAVAFYNLRNIGGEKYGLSKKNVIV